jgi:DNA-binding NtrC family response regulator
VIPIEIPPLRERKEDIPLLAEAFVRKHREGRPRSIRPEAAEMLCRFRWEGNARELENVIERALALEDADELGPDSIPTFEETGREEPESGDRGLLEEALGSNMTLSELEDRYTAEVLAKTDGNKARAARILGINRRTLYRRGFTNRSGEFEHESEGGTA